MNAISSNSNAAFFGRWMRLSRATLLGAAAAAVVAALLQTEAGFAAAGGLFLLFGINLAVLYRYATYHLVSIQVEGGIATIQTSRFNARGRSIVPAHQVSARIARVPLRFPALFRLELEHGGQLIVRQYSIEDWTEQRLLEIQKIFASAAQAAEDQ